MLLRTLKTSKVEVRSYRSEKIVISKKIINNFSEIYEKTFVNF